MTNTMFLTLLILFASITTMVTEAIKKLFDGTCNLNYNAIAIISAFIVSSIGTIIVYQLLSIPFTLNNIIYIGLMGFFSALGSMVGYDKVSQLLNQFIKHE